MSKEKISNFLKTYNIDDNCIDSYNKDTLNKICDIIDGKIEENYDNNILNKYAGLVTCYNNSNTEIIRKLIDMYSIDRSTNYKKWITVGWALHNTDPNLLNEFIRFSKKSQNKYKEGCCEKIWKNIKSEKNKYTMSSLYWWAKEDNPNEYKKLMYDLSQII